MSPAETKRVEGNLKPYGDETELPFVSVNGIGGANISGPYEAVVGWPEQPHPGEWRSGAGRGVIAESPDKIYVVRGGELPSFQDQTLWGHNAFLDLRYTDVYPDNQLEVGRHCHEIVIYDRRGQEVANWDKWLPELHANHGHEIPGALIRHDHVGDSPNLGYLNRIRVDPFDTQRHIWIVGSENTGALKFTNDGSNLVLKIDADKVPEQYRQFIYGQDIAFLPDGQIVIGHSHCLMKFTSKGDFIALIGKRGSGPGEFDGIHGVEIHPKTANMYVADRANKRIQILDPDGQFIAEWPGFFGVSTIRISADGENMWTSNGLCHKFLKYDLKGKLIPEATWGTFGVAPGAIWGPHYFETDSEGNLYVAEDYTGRVQKFRVLAGVEPDHPQLIGPLSR